MELLKELLKEISRLEQLAFVDPLTGAQTRCWLNEHVDQVHGFDSVGIADMNGLKEINDTIGHAEGDYQITRCADQLKQACEVLVRLGGDEFLMLGVNQDKLASLGDTACVGVSEACLLSFAMAEADEAMYKQKLQTVTEKKIAVVVDRVIDSLM